MVNLDFVAEVISLAPAEDFEDSSHVVSSDDYVYDCER